MSTKFVQQTDYSTMLEYAAAGLLWFQCPAQPEPRLVVEGDYIFQHVASFVYFTMEED